MCILYTPLIWQKALTWILKISVFLSAFRAPSRFSDMQMCYIICICTTHMIKFVFTISGSRQPNLEMASRGSAGTSTFPPYSSAVTSPTQPSHNIYPEYYNSPMVHRLPSDTVSQNVTVTKNSATSQLSS